MDHERLEALRRNSGIGLTCDGAFTVNGRPVANERVQALFHRGLRVREDGDVVLHVGSRWCYVACEGVARYVEAVRLTAGGLVARLSSGAEVTSAAPVLGYAPDDRFYLWCDPQGPPGLLRRAAHQDLLAQVGDDLTIASPCGPIPVLRLDAAPGPAAPAPQGAAGRSSEG